MVKVIKLKENSSFILFAAGFDWSEVKELTKRKLPYSPNNIVTMDFLLNNVNYVN